MTDARAEFLAAERPDDVALYLADSYVSDDRLERFGERVDGGVLLVVDGERGRNAFRAATGTGAMEFAGKAMKVDGDIDADLTGGTCPNQGAADSTTGKNAEGVEDDEDHVTEGAESDEDHATQFVFAFAEEQNEEVGDLYAEGDVVHAYAQCSCGAAYSDRWVVDE